MTAAENPLDVLQRSLSGDGATARYYKQQTNWEQFRAEREAERAALSAVEQLVEAARDTSEPFMDERFRDRLLRHALSNDEIEQFVDAVESSQQRLTEALARFPVPAQDTGGET